MRRSVRATRLLIPGVLALLSAASLAGQPVTAVAFESHDLSEKQTLQGQMRFRDDVLRIDGDKEGKSGANSMIYRGDLQLVWFLQHDKRQYIEMDRQTLEEMSSQISGMLAQIEEQLKSLPPKQREAMSRAMKSRLPIPDPTPPSPPEIRASGEHQEISGFKCQRYDVYQDAEKTAEVWATPVSAIPAAGNLRSVFQSLAEFYRSLTQGFAQFQTGMNFNLMAELDGFPIHILNYDDGQLASEMRIRQIRQEEAPDDLFEKPENYKQQKMSIPR